MRVLKLFLVGILGLAAVTPVLAQTPPNPLSVDEAVEIALKQNRAFLGTQAGRLVAEGTRRSAISALLPSFNGGYSWSERQSTTNYGDLPTLIDNDLGIVLETAALEFFNGSTSDGFNFGVNYDLSLQEWLNFRSSAAGLGQTELSIEDAAQDLAYTVRQQFYLVLRAQDLLQVQQEDLRLAQDEERRVTSMFEVGSVARADVMKAKVRVSDAEVALIQQENTVEIEGTRLAVLLGYQADTDLTLEGNLTPELSTMVDSTSAVREAKTRADVEAARLGLKSASLASRSADFYWLPSFFARYNWNDTEDTRENDTLVDQDILTITSEGDTLNYTSYYVFRQPEVNSSGDGWSVEVGASVNLDALLFFTGSQRQAKGRKLQAQYQLEDLELEAQRELEEAILNLRASVRSIGSAQDAVDSAEEDLRLSQERYEQGLGTILELLESQVALTRARNQLVNALTGLRISEAAYDKARGADVLR